MKGAVKQLFHASQTCLDLPSPITYDSILHVLALKGVLGHSANGLRFHFGVNEVMVDFMAGVV